MIDLSRFGNLDATPQPLQDVGSSNAVFARTGARLLGDAQNIVGQMEQADAAQSEQLRRSRMAVKAAEFKNGLTAIGIGLDEDANTGRLNADEIGTAYETRSGEYATDFLSTMSPKDRKDMQGATDLYRATYADNINSMQRKAVAGQSVGEYRKGFDTYKARALLSPDNIGESLAGVDQLSQILNPYIAPAERTALVSKDKNELVKDALLSSIQNLNKPGDLKALRGQLYTEGVYPDLVDGHTQVVNSIDSRIREIDAGIKAKRNEWEISVRESMSLIGDAFSDGRVSAATQLEYDDLLDRTRGSKYAPAVKALGETLKARVEVSRLPISGQIEAARRARADSTAAAGAADESRRQNTAEAVERQVAANRAAIESNAWQYALDVHAIETPPLDLNGNITQQMKSRQPIARKIQAVTGKNPGLFQPGEVPYVKDNLDKLSAHDQGQFFAGFNSVDQETRNATLAEIGKVDAVKMNAGMQIVLGHKTKSGGDVGVMILEGQGYLARKEVEFPKDTDKLITKTVNAAVSGALSDNPADYAAVEPAVRAVLASKSKGSLSINRAYTVSDINSAISIVTGGFTTYNDRPTLLPYGMSGGDFAQKAPVAVASRLLSLGYSREEANKLRESAVLRPAKQPGEYFLFIGRDIVTDKGNQPARLMVK